jgi:hypothetical protein
MKWTVLVAGLALSIVFALPVPKMLMAAGEDKSFVEEEARIELEETMKLQPKTETGFLYDYGGWAKTSFYFFDDAARKRAMRSQDIRLWLNSRIGPDNEFYIRAKSLAVDYSRGDEFGAENNYWIKSRMDQGFYKVNLTPYLFDEELKPNSPRVSLQLGRQHMSLGTGLIYNRIDDGLKLSVNYCGFDSQVLLARTVKSSADIDQTRPDADHSRRQFFGLQADYKKLGRHRPYFIGLIQQDRNNENPDDPFQDYGYNSSYYGLGAAGILMPKLHYTVEYINESGTSYGSFSTSRERIKASARLVQLKYLPDMKLEPVITLRYLFGSGDQDRGNATGTLGGNTSDTNDTNFMYFGYAMTGYVMEPKLSNLQVYNLSASVKPLKDKPSFEKTEVGISFYTFQKDKKDGAISDLAAIVAKKDVGSEIDFFANWKVLSDFVITLRGGIFTPGGAYPAGADDKTTFYNIGFTYSF